MITDFILYRHYKFLWSKDCDEKISFLNSIFIQYFISSIHQGVSRTTKARAECDQREKIIGSGPNYTKFRAMSSYTGAEILYVNYGP